MNLLIKKIKVDVNNMDICDPTHSDLVWIKFKGMCLTEADKDAERTHTDLHINVAQELLKRQFPHISCLQSTLLLSKCKSQQHLPKLSTLVEHTCKTSINSKSAETDPVMA